MPRILIVDDSVTIRRMVRASLNSLTEVSFAEAATGLEALERLALEPVAMLILDLNMPDMHGLEVLKFVRTHQAHKRTTRGDEPSRAAALSAGATVYVTKPFAPQALAALARDLLDGGSEGESPRVPPR
jgi:two-component system chemotaxis response regulator CheY